MDGRLALLIIVGVGSLGASLLASPTYFWSWILLGLLALTWAGVVVFRNSRRGPNKHGR